MANRKGAPGPANIGPGRLTTSRSAFVSELADRIERGNELLAREISSPSTLDEVRADFYTWDEYNSQLLKRRFTTNELAESYRDFAFGSIGGGNLYAEVQELQEDIRRKIRRLQSIEAQASLFDEPATQGPEVIQSDGSRQRHIGSSIFVVHGHADVRKLEVVRFIAQITDQTPIVLHEQANEGRTIIEKLEYFGHQTGFAVVLLTADDEGRERGTDAALLPRGRQNVVMELGYFIAALGREHVVLLYENEVELPSDMTGVLFVRLDSAGGWKLALARELKAAGVPADLNKAS